MEPLFIASLRALRSLFAPGMLGMAAWSILITILALTGFVVIASGFFQWVALQMQDYFWSGIIPWLAGIGSFLLAWFLFPAIMPFIVNFFDDRIARLIESSDYPGLLPAADIPFWQELAHDARFSLGAITLNILILPFYFLMPGLHFLPFYALNGYLLGREFFTMAAKRHSTLGQADALYKRHRRNITIAGVMIAICATIPLVNLIAPFWGIAVMVHLYHQLPNPAGDTVFPE